MPAPFKTGVKAHDDAVAAAEGIRQQGVATAAGTGATLASNVRSVELTYFRTCYNSALTNNISASIYTQALKSLGVQS
jgi:hypothetical protein